MPVCRMVSVSPEGLGYRKRTDPVGDASTKILKWGSVREVQVFKRDLWSEDLLCMQILIEGRKEPIEFDEHDLQWERLASDLPKLLPGCQTQDEWWPKAIQPPMATCLTTIYVRRCVGPCVPKPKHPSSGPKGSPKPACPERRAEARVERARGK